MEDFPAAFVIASREAVSRNNNVLYRLVRSLPDGSGVESVDRLVNVVPHRRSYCMDRKNEIDDFKREILKRPLVLQPILHFGRGIGHYCGACYTDEPWVVMINQTHPKVLSRLQMGLDMAKSAIEKGQPVELKFDFGDIIQKVYREHLQQMEEEEAGIDNCLVNFRYAEWEHCALKVRSHGIAARFNRSAPLFAFHNLELTFKFEDIGMHEMMWRQVDGVHLQKPHLAHVSEAEIRAVLPGWTINSVSPLADIGEDVPEHNYSYAQAGRLYESFRKKKQPRIKTQYSEAVVNNDGFQDVELQGAVGYSNSYNNIDPDYIEQEEGNYRSARDTLQHNRLSQHHPHSRHSYNDSGVEDDLEKNQIPVTDSYSHVNAKVVVKPSQHSGARPQVSNPGKTLTSLYGRPGPSSDYHEYNSPLKKQDSDRSSRSTNADSGYSPETEGYTSRDDLNDYINTTNPAKSHFTHFDGKPLVSNADPAMGLENPSFQDYESVAMQRHKELVSNVIREQNGVKKPPRTNMAHKENRSRLSDNAVTLSPKDLIQTNYNSYENPHLIKPKLSTKVAESFI